MIGLALFASAFMLAFSNGANDNFKGVASLYGSGTTTYPTALVWGTAATLMGSFASIVIARGLIESFSGNGLVPDAVAGGELFLVSVAAGAAATVLTATRLGLPISTTHSLVGGIIGAGYVASGSALNLDVLASSFLAPLVFSPLVAVVLAGALYLVLHLARVGFGVAKDSCICVGLSRAQTVSDGSIALRDAIAFGTEVSIDSKMRCTERYQGRLVGIGTQRLIDALHFLSAGVVSFARGLNDTPKIVALVLVLPVLDVSGALTIIGAGMAAGGLLASRRVAMTLGRKITGMNHGQGLAANLATGVLVIWASRLGLPVSTTHVSVGSLFGIGVVTRQGRLPVIRNVILSWIATLPCAAAFAAIIYSIVSTVA